MTIHPTGTCFEDVTMQFAERIRDDKRLLVSDFFMVHGICLFPDGRPYSHAWIEEGDKVWFPGIFSKLGKGFGLTSVEEFYREYRVQERTRYNFRDLLEIGARLGNEPPPWEERYRVLCRDYKPVGGGK